MIINIFVLSIIILGVVLIIQFRDKKCSNCEFVETANYEFCNTPIPESYSICPKCRRMLKPKGFGYLVGLIFCTIGCIFLLINLINPHNINSAQSGYNSPKITMQEFNSLQAGMSYEDAAYIIGGYGEILSSSSFSGYVTTLYTWEGVGSIGANANAMFQNGKLVSKAQYGLK